MQGIGKHKGGECVFIIMTAERDELAVPETQPRRWTGNIARRAPERDVTAASAAAHRSPERDVASASSAASRAPERDPVAASPPRPEEGRRWPAPHSAAARHAPREGRGLGLRSRAPRP